MANEILRFLPGNTAKPDGTNVAVGAWIGWIGRDYFDGLYLASAYTARFFSYPTKIEKPDITNFLNSSYAITTEQKDGDGAFSPTEGGFPITSMNTDEDTISFTGSYVFAFGKMFKVENRTQDYGWYKVKKVTVESDGTTKLWADATYREVAHSTKGGSVRIATQKDTRYYRFSYVYDGVQESLLSDQVQATFEDMKFFHLIFPVYPATFNKRITAVKIYRSTDYSGILSPYRHIHTIDLLREDDEVIGGLSGFYDCKKMVYIPDMSGQVSGRTPAGAGKIKLFNKNGGNWTVELATVSYSADTSRVLFELTEDIYSEADHWDCAWQYSALGDFTDTIEGSSGAFAGWDVGIAGEDLTGKSYAGGVINFDYVIGFNNTGNFRLIDDNYKRAVHFTSKVDHDGYLADDVWRIVCPEDGNYFVVGGETHYDYSFFDTNLPDGATHPLEGEVSIEVHGKFAKMIGGRLFQANLVLDPAGEAEEHPDWCSYSEINQPDVTPVSNVIKLQDREGGELTGLDELFGMAVFTMKQGIIAVNCKDNPGDPQLWKISESIHDIGNIAPMGLVRAGDALYTCAHDGIYRITPNNLAASDSTPTDKLEITKPIHNIYNSMTVAQKQAIRAIYHHPRNEIHYFMTYPVDGTPLEKHWSYNVVTGAWRECFTSWFPNYLALDENANAMILNTYLSAESQQYCWVLALETTLDEQYGRFVARSKWFTISNDSPEPINRIVVIYKSPHALKLRIYLNGNETAAAEYTLPAQATSKPYTVGVGYSAHRMQFAITDETGLPLIAEETYGGPVYLIVEQNEVSPNVEISGIDII